MFKKNALLFGFLLLLSGISYAQNPAPLSQGNFKTPQFEYSKFSKAEIKFDDSLSKLFIRAVDMTLIFPKDSKKLVISENHDLLIKNAFLSISGSEVKAGKAVSSSAVIDDKSLTVNVAFKPFNFLGKQIYVTPVASGESKDNFVNFLDKGSYSNTISLGSNFTVLTKLGSSSFDTLAKRTFHTQLRDVWYDYIDKGRALEQYLAERLVEVKAGLNGNAVSQHADGNPSSTILQEVKTFEAAVDTLIGIGLLPPYFAELNVVDQKNLIGRYDQRRRIEDVVFKKMLDKLDAMQLKDAFNGHSVKWVTFGAKFNSAGHKLLDLDAEALTTTKRQNYLSANLSFTFFKSRKSGNRFYFSPTLTYSNEFDYSDDLLLKAQVLGTSFSAGKAGMATPVIHDLEYYAVKVTDRVNNVNLDLPLAWYSTKHRFGMEIGLKATPNDPDKDKFGARIGLFIPLNPGSESQIMIQPIVKFKMLNDVGHFFEDHIVAGVNLSISLPKGLFASK